MDFAFYDQAGGPALGDRLLSPVRRLVRRALRPAFLHLRGTLEKLAADGLQDRRNVDVAVKNLMRDRADDRTRAAQTAADLRAHLARVQGGVTAAREEVWSGAAALREAMAGALAEAAATRDEVRAESAALAAALRDEIAGFRAEVGEVRKLLELARSLAAEYHGLARRVDRVEDAAHAALARALDRAA